MLYSKSVSIPYPPVLDISLITRVKVRHVPFDVNDLNPEFIEYLQKLNLYVSFAEIFYTKPDAATSIHIDVHSGDFTKINYIYGGEDSQMCWYLPVGSTIGEQNITVVNSKSITFTPKQVTLAYTDRLIEPSIVQVGVPHNVVNGKHHRHCLSIVINENNERVSMGRAVEIFSSTQ